MDKGGNKGGGLTTATRTAIRGNQNVDGHGRRGDGFDLPMANVTFGNRVTQGRADSLSVWKRSCASKLVKDQAHLFADDCQTLNSLMVSTSSKSQNIGHVLFLCLCQSGGAEKVSCLLPSFGCGAIHHCCD